jgi:hypothetical protein
MTAVLGEPVLIFGVFALGAICMLLGFFTVVRGIGASDSEATVKMLGIEFHASKLGPGLVFSVLGLILVVVAVSVEKSPPDKPAATLASGPAPAGAPTQANATQSDQPSQAAPAAASIPPVQPAQSIDNAKPASMSHEDVADLIQDTLSKIALGYCPPESLEPLPLNGCEQNVAMMRQAFVMAGPIRSVSYYGKMTTPAGDADQYMVIFQNSGPVIWKAAVTQNRKFSGLWTGQP